ncbi:MAG: hypothetical protein ACREHD_32795 [Pirellulales bacterium]
MTDLCVAVETLNVEVTETAGIRRFGYPLSVKLPTLPSGPANARLRDAGKAVAAQFRQDHHDGAEVWWLDFNLSLMPNESRTLTLAYGPDVAADPEPRGLELKQMPDGFEIRNGPHLTWTLGRDLVKLLKSVDAGELQHLRSGGARLDIAGANDVPYKIADEATPRVLRSGPLAIAIRYQFAPTTGALAETKSTIDLTFPNSKSWVQVEWQMEDPRQAVRSVRAEIAQNLDPPTDKEPTLVDFGASSLVYMSLAPGTAGKFYARRAVPQSKSPVGPSWEILRGANEKLEPFVVAASRGRSADAEGWAHVMDRRRCLALAIGEFGNQGDDSIETTAEGNLSLTRRFATDEPNSSMTKRFQFWLHFVGFPLHLTAATSPQAMLSPLVVRISKP